MKKKLAILISALLIMSFPMAIMADSPTQTITEIVAEKAGAEEEFTVLAAALEEAELLSTLNSAGSYTVFAPTDAAFADLLATLGITAEELLAQPDLSDVLLYHVISGKIMSYELVDASTPATLNGETVTVDLDGGTMINDANVTDADIEATNGVIHVIDKVLVPSGFVLQPTQSIVDIALGNENFSILVSALQAAGLVETLQGAGPFTVFAPTNDAFVALLGALDITAEDLLLQPDLSSVLLYHVLSGKFMSSDLSDGMMAETVNGEDVEITIPDGVMVNDANVVSADIEATNGVVHVIDGVLIPTAFELQDVTEEPDIADTGDTIPFIAGGLTLAGILLAGVLLLNKRTQKSNLSKVARIGESRNTRVNTPPDCRLGQLGGVFFAVDSNFYKSVSSTART